MFAIGAAAAAPPRARARRRGPHRRQPRAPSVDRRPRAAELSGDSANDHLCEGFVEDVIANLTRFRNLMVIARHSAFMFSLKSHAVARNRPAPRRALPAGRQPSPRRQAHPDRRRADRRGDRGALWSDHFNIDMEELFDLQDEITGAVASRLASQIDFAERRQESYHPRDMLAYGLVLRGQQLVAHFTKEANAHARRLFEEASMIAPEYGRAYSSLSRTHNLDWRYSWSPAPEQSLECRGRAGAPRRRARSARRARLRRARIRPSLQEAAREALAEYARALALNPNDADIIAEYADALVYAGQPAKSVELLEQAMRLNPVLSRLVPLVSRRCLHHDAIATPT